MNRREFTRKLAVAAVVPAAGIPDVSQKINPIGIRNNGKALIPFGGPVFNDEYDSPGSWMEAMKSKGYTAARSPVEIGTDEKLVEAYKHIANREGIIIAEVGAWSNPLHPDDQKRREALNKCIESLELADRIGACCCVNVSGSRGMDKIGGPHPDNLTKDTFDMIVETCRKIIDSVKPKHTYFTLEMMPCAYPDSVDSYLDLIRAIDRDRFAVHFDPVNLINSPQRYFNNSEIIKEAFNRLGHMIKSCHAKDTWLRNDLTLHIDEVVPGTGHLDYKAYLMNLRGLDNVPLVMEHMKREEYPVAAEYIRKTGAEIGVRC